MPSISDPRRAQGTSIAPPPLTEVRLENFKSVQSAAIQLKHLTVVVGKNSSGKSTLLQSVLSLAQAVRNRFGESRFPLNGEFVKLGTFDEVLNFQHDGSEPEIVIGFTINGGRRPSRFPRSQNSAAAPSTITWNGYLRAPEQISDGFAEFKAFQYEISSENADGNSARFVLDVAHVLGEFELGRYSVIISENGIRRLNRSLVLVEGRSVDWSSGESSVVRGVRLNGGLPTAAFFEVSRFDSLARMWWDYYSDALAELINQLKETESEKGQHWMVTSEMLSFASQDLRSVFALERSQNTPLDVMDDAPTYLPNSFGRSPNMVFQRTLVRLSEEARLSVAKGIAFVDESKFRLGLRNVFVDRDLAEENPWWNDAESLENLFPTEEESQWLDAAWLDEKVLEPVRSRTGRELAEATRESEALFESLQYLGPLREEPKPLYNPGTSRIDLGSNGEFSAAVLHAQRKTVVLSPLPGVNSEPKQMKLEAALNMWLVELGLADSATATDRGRLGIGLEVSPMGSGRNVDLTSVGVGVSQVLPVLLLCLLSRPGSVVLIEQPELHLHPAMQLRLADFLLACAKSGRQIIVETHSEHLVNRLRLHVASGDTAGAEDVIQLLFAEQEGGITTYRPSAINPLGGLSEDWPGGFLDVGAIEAGELLKQTVIRHRQLIEE